MKKYFTFQIAVIFLLIASVFSLPAFIAEFARGFYPDSIPLAYLANSLTLTTLVLCIPCITGFINLGHRIQNNLIKYASVASLVLLLLSAVGAVYMLNVPTVYLYSNLALAFSACMLQGLVLVLFGIGFIQAKNAIGRYSLSCGILNIIVGLCFVLIVPIYLGLLLLPPLGLLEAFILSDAARKYEK